MKNLMTWTGWSEDDWNEIDNKLETIAKIISIPAIVFICWGACLFG